MVRSRTRFVMPNMIARIEGADEGCGGGVGGMVVFVMGVVVDGRVGGRVWVVVLLRVVVKRVVLVLMLVVVLVVVIVMVAGGGGGGGGGVGVGDGDGDGDGGGGGGGGGGADGVGDGSADDVVPSAKRPGSTRSPRASSGLAAGSSISWDGFIDVDEGSSASRTFFSLQVRFMSCGFGNAIAMTTATAIGIAFEEDERNK